MISCIFPHFIITNFLSNLCLKLRTGPQYNSNLIIKIAKIRRFLMNLPVNIMPWLNSQSGNKFSMLVSPVG